MSSPTIPPGLLNQDPAVAYQRVYDALGRAYWDAADIASKDLIHGTQEAIGDIITAYDEQDLANNTALFVQLTPKIKAINKALSQIKDEVATITKNINTATLVVSTIGSLLALVPV
jgi:hypothetical protein